jgi:pimeloyl-ACP methyl ester carboxylesterase
MDWEGWASLAEDQGSERWARETNKFRLDAKSEPALREWYVTQQARTPGWLLAKVFRYASTVDLTPRLKDVKAPTLILAGTESKQDTIESVRAAIGNMPNAKLVAIEGAPFNVMTARPQECITATMDFLAGQK